MDLKIISAGAGSGKTYRLTQEMVGLLAEGTVRPSGIIATTFTNKAAAELEERVRVKLLEDGMVEAANELGNSLIGTVHGLGVKLLKRFAFEAGVSPQVDIMADDDQQVMFNQSLAMVLTNDRVGEMEVLSERLGFNKSIFNTTNWRKLLLQLTEIARSNNFSKETLERSKVRSLDSFLNFLDEPKELDAGVWKGQLEQEIDEAISRLENNGDTTKITATGVKSLRELKSELNLRGALFWHQWAKLTKTRVGAKSKDDLQALVDFANTHLSHSGFHNDVKSFIYNLFDIAQLAIDEYGRYKLSRGLIDYTDMEVQVNKLLDVAIVQECLQEELDLLMVDEFQDTSPLQLEIFLKLSKLSKHAVWVGDPKQSIYGFRGAEPKLMQAIIAKAGGLKKENILEYSWRSREDIVNACNAIFTKAFSQMPVEQIALKAKRSKVAKSNSINKRDEPDSIQNAIVHWHFEYDGEGRKPGRTWVDHCIADSVNRLLEREILILPKGENSYRKIEPGDIAILCRSNKNCLNMAEALHQVGLNVAISRAGLLSTAEAKLILACLKYILNPADTLSVAEIRLLASATSLEEIVIDRIQYLEQIENGRNEVRWGGADAFIVKLFELRNQVIELSSAEILTLVLEEMNLRRIIATWGNVTQRFGNVDEFIKLSFQYEEACNRMHTAASLGGFLLWLYDLENNELDLQAAAENQQAINILTYHKSKGLEYPVVICHNIDQPLRDDVWGLNMVAESQEVDLNNLLGNRWLRLWVNPYSDQFRNTILAERIDESTVKSAKRSEALEEEARLLYVGTTRARDFLVFPTYHKPPIWLNRVYYNGDESRPVFDVHSDISPWEWEGERIATKIDVKQYPDSFGQMQAQNEEVVLLEKPKGSEKFPVYIKEEFEIDSSGTKFEFSSYRKPLTLPEVIERQLVGKAIVSFFKSHAIEADRNVQVQIAEKLIHSFDIDGLIEAEDFIDCGNAFRNWLKSNFEVIEQKHNYPIRIHLEEQLFAETIHLMIKCEDVCVLLFHSSFVGNTKAQEKHLKVNLGRLMEVKKAMKEVHSSFKIKLYFHFVLEGTLVEI